MKFVVYYKSFDDLVCAYSIDVNSLDDLQDLYMKYDSDFISINFMKRQIILKEGTEIDQIAKEIFDLKDVVNGVETIADQLYGEYGGLFMEERIF